MNTALILLNIIALSAVIGLSHFGTAQDQIAQIHPSPALSARQAVMGDSSVPSQAVSTTRLSF